MINAMTSKKVKANGDFIDYLEHPEHRSNRPGVGKKIKRHMNRKLRQSFKAELAQYH